MLKAGEYARFTDVSARGLEPRAGVIMLVADDTALVMVEGALLERPAGDLVRLLSICPTCHCPQRKPRLECYVCGEDLSYSLRT